MAMNPRLAAAFSLVNACVFSGLAIAQPPPPPPPPAPALSTVIPAAPTGNAPSEPKRILGKILFWDEQLSSDNTMSCGTCHTPARGGGDRRRVNNFGPDGLTGTGPTNADDAFGSPGTINSDINGKYVSSTVYGFTRQVTGRTAPPAIVAALFENNLFWDGRATGVFTDPQTGLVALNGRAALESQSVGPPVADMEMAHDGRTWAEATGKISSSRPLALATALPSDVANALASNPTYPQLFVAAFGDGTVTAARIAMAIATYERTLIPDQTPWDSFNAGNIGAMNDAERRGLGAFISAGSHCNACHVAPLFSDENFHALGLRPSGEDLGRQIVTGNPGDRGRFKTATLRNVGLKQSFFHNGVRTTLADAVGFYAPGTPRFDNVDGLVQNIQLPPNAAADIVAFLSNALTDPRVAAATFPFDKPTIWDERGTDKPILAGGGTSGVSGLPQMIATDPPMIGAKMRLGIFSGRANATATLVMGDAAPVGGAVQNTTPLGSVTLDGTGVGTFFWTIPATLSNGQVKFLQWNVTDSAAVGGIARTQAARLQFFCQRGGCTSACKADVGVQGGVPGFDGVLDNNDFVVFISQFFTLNGGADIGRQGGVAGADGRFDNNDFVVFIDSFFAGCG